MTTERRDREDGSDGHSFGGFSRREALGIMAACLGGTTFAGVAEPFDGPYDLATFSADVTPPLGHPLMGGGIAPARRVDDPLFARGFVLRGEGQPVVLVVVDWCEIRNDAHDRWREAVAEAAATAPGRVMVTSVHQHDAPIADLEAQRILETAKAGAAICDLAFHERAVRGVAQAVRDALRTPRRVTHFGVGQAKVEEVASNRRYIGPDGKPAFDRGSTTRDPRIREAPEGTIDPWLKTISFWDGERPLVALSVYATHPMSAYGKGAVSSDFVGLARGRRQEAEPGVFQVYASGCSGNVTAGKYNDGTPGNRDVLAGRIQRAMASAWKATRRQPLTDVDFRSVPLRLEPRESEGFTLEDLDRRLTTAPEPFGKCLAALGLSWRKRIAPGRTIDVPVLDLGGAQLLLLPGESYVEYQLLAQSLRPNSSVVVMGYGESATGYVPTESAFEEGDSNLGEWCWVSPGAELAMTSALRATLLGGPK